MPIQRDEPTPVKTGRSWSAPPFQHLIAIGTSTGGPRALHAVLTALPADLPAPVLVVQHMPPKFTKSLAERLNASSAITVVEGADGMIVEKGTAYIAPGGYHMMMVRDEAGVYRIKLTLDDPVSGHRPSVNVLFQSLLPFQELKKYVVLMTGMGSDGAKGMQALALAGSVATIAESEETCVVYGMPRAAVQLECVTHILPLHEIPGKLSVMIQG
ncbi:CheB methylesterase domain-containing protein [Gorillibacterium timonense]|uniref:CheB methylesterase domain-containing protein n=1 Tax=Gorillibacterium timonense TaxID=1689269 RepID=UPI00071E2130|nr:CheB methylesterase domain-containing protein [Gorillibacterium timonense]